MKIQEVSKEIDLYAQADDLAYQLKQVKEKIKNTEPMAGITADEFLSEPAHGSQIEQLIQKLKNEAFVKGLDAGRKEGYDRAARELEGEFNVAVNNMAKTSILRRVIREYSEPF